MDSKDHHLNLNLTCLLQDPASFLSLQVFFWIQQTGQISSFTKQQQLLLLCSSHPDFESFVLPSSPPGISRAHFIIIIIITKELCSFHLLKRLKFTKGFVELKHEISIDFPHSEFINERSNEWWKCNCWSLTNFTIMMKLDGWNLISEFAWRTRSKLIYSWFSADK